MSSDTGATTDADSTDVAETTAETAETPTGVGEPAYAPPYVASGLAIGGALLVLTAVGTTSFTAASTAALGAWILGAGLSRGGSRIVTAAAAVLFGSVLVAGAQGSPNLTLLAAAVGTAIAFDGSRYAIRLGDQIGRQAPTQRAELVHLSMTALTAVSSAVVGYLVFLFGSGEQTTTTLVALLVAALLLISGLYLSQD